MDFERLKEMARAEGFIEDFLEEAHKKMSAEYGETTYAEELQKAWLILTAGLNKLRSENQTMQNKLAGVHNLLDT